MHLQSAYISFPQTLQDAATVWMRTEATVYCVPSLCSNNGARTIRDTLYYRDPLYLPVANGAKHVTDKSVPYSEVVSSSWGSASSHMWDTDRDKMREMLRGLFQGKVPNTQLLFANDASVFTESQVNSCFGLSTMSANAHKCFMGEWLQHGAQDDPCRLLAAEEVKRRAGPCG